MVKEFEELRKQPLFYSKVDLIATAQLMRTQETNTANMIADILRTALPGTNFVILNCGTLRTNTVIPTGIISKGQML